MENIVKVGRCVNYNLAMAVGFRIMPDVELYYSKLGLRLRDRFNADMILLQYNIIWRY
jgi:hypothetical protein